MHFLSEPQKYIGTTRASTFMLVQAMARAKSAIADADNEQNYC